MYKCVLCERLFSELPDDKLKVDVVSYRHSLLYVVDGRAHELVSDGDQSIQESPVEPSPYREVPRKPIKVAPPPSQPSAETSTSQPLNAAGKEVGDAS